MKITIERVNKWAKMSCPRYCSSKTKRSLCKALYLAAVETSIKTPAQAEITEETLAGKYWCDSYPWPFYLPEFANWPEHHSEKYYSLVTDHSGCIVKHDTSYIAWKIRELTGSWPEKTDLIKFTYDDWIQFLANSGYSEIRTALKRGHKYVGIYTASKQKRTIAVWYEVSKPDMDNHRDKPIIVTTYLNKEFKALRVRPQDFTWVKIK